MTRLCFTLWISFYIGALGAEPLEPVTSESKTTAPETEELQSAQQSDNSEGEKLLATPPPEWIQTYSLNTEKTRLVDFVPPSETIDDWKTKLSFESHQSLIEVDPISILMGELDAARQNCEKIESFNLFSGLENEYPTSVRLTFCGENAHTREGEITISKAIQGGNFLYLIKLLRRVPAFTALENTLSEREIAAWADYFGRITLCDETSPEHPCPTPSEEPEDTPG